MPCGLNRSRFDLRVRQGRRHHGQRFAFQTASTVATARDSYRQAKYISQGNAGATQRCY